MNNLPAKIRSVLDAKAEPETALPQVLVAVLAHFNSETGSIHRLDATKQELHLLAQIGLPPTLLDAVRLIPVGKGIAGQVIARGGPVTICNIQDDKSGVARPGAKQSGMGGALCVALRANDDIVGTIGVGTVRQHEYTAEETKLLEEVGELLGEFVK